MAKSINVQASKLVRSGVGTIYGIIVNSHTNGTLKLWDNTSAAVAETDIVCDTFTFPTGSGVFMFPAPIDFTTGLYATVGGTLNCQLILN